MTRRLLPFALALLWTSALSAEALLPYQDPNRSDESRVDDLIERMTLTEKVGQMCQYVGLEHIQKSEKHLTLEEMEAGDAHGIYPDLHSSEIPALIERGEIGSFLHVKNPSEANLLQRHASRSRLGIPLLIGIDAVHGNGLVRGSTIYPTPLSMASSWNLDLVRRANVETAIEMRANGAQWAFAPNVDIARDARWGRVGETFGEDTHLVSEMGRAVIEGLQQGDFRGETKVIATAKHFVAGGAPSNGINHAPMDVSLRTLREDYFPPFQRAVAAGAFTFMAAHNEINGVPAHANAFLFDEVLRGEWGFEGFVVSDWMDIERLETNHRVAPNQKEAVFQSVNAGLDMHMHGPNFLEPLLALVEEGRIPEARIDAAVRPILLAKFRLGLFENSQVDLAAAKASLFPGAHRATALALARQGIVLLKNDGVLPLNAPERIFVTGPNADSHALLGDWVFAQPEENVTTVVEGLRALAGEGVDFYDVGNQVKRMKNLDLVAIESRASEADVAIVVVGENALRQNHKGKTGGENIARSAIDLFGRQLELVQAVHASGTPTVVVFVNNRPIAEPWIAEHAAAIVEAWEPGALGGQAISEILFGEVNPSGKLPITIPHSAGHIRAIYDDKPTARIRRYVDAPTQNLFEFGDGLSYTMFRYGSLLLSSSEIANDESVIASIDLTNDGDRPGDEVVQLYVRDDFSRVTRPLKELKGFQRVSLEPGQTRTIEFTITPDVLAYYDLDMNWLVEPGDFTIMIGPSSRDSGLSKAKLRVIAGRADCGWRPAFLCRESASTRSVRN